MKITGQQAVEAIRKQKRCIYRRITCSRRCEICDLDIDYELTAEACDLAIESIHRDTIRKWAEDHGGRYMTIDEAIKHAEEEAKEQDKLCKRYDAASGYERSHNEEIRTSDAKRCEKCAEEHRQLAEWLKELKQLREKTRWIPVSEGLPKEKETVIASTEYGVFPEARYTKENGWEWAYEYGADYWEKFTGIKAWMHLPKRYKTESEV